MIKHVFIGMLMLLVMTSCGDSEVVREPEDVVEPKERLTVLTYNIQQGVPEGGTEVNLENIAAVIRLSGAEVVALQEVDMDVPRSGNVEQAKKLAELLDMEYYFSRSIYLNGGEYGNAILSKHPLTNKRNFPLPPSAEQRSIGLATVTLPNGKTFEFGSTHFQNGTGQHAENRMAQSKYLNELSNELEKPLIIGGDYNATPTSAAVRELEQEFNLACVNGCPSTHSARIPTRAIDFMIYNELAGQSFSLVSATAMRGQYASDHLPKIAVFAY